MASLFNGDAGFLEADDALQKIKIVIFKPAPASKFGVHGLSETIRQEVAGDNVRISLVAPGAGETELLTHVTDAAALKDYEAWKQTMGGLTLDAKYVAQTVKFIYDMPQAVNIREIDLAATRQDS